MIPQILKLLHNPDVTVRTHGVMECKLNRLRRAHYCCPHCCGKPRLVRWGTARGHYGLPRKRVRRRPIGSATSIICRVRSRRSKPCRWIIGSLAEFGKSAVNHESGRGCVIPTRRAGIQDGRGGEKRAEWGHRMSEPVRHQQGPHTLLQRWTAAAADMRLEDILIGNRQNQC